MKFVKGVAVFLVCCLAVYGAFALLKRPPKLDIPESDLSVLSDLGMDVQNTRAEASGRSAIFGDVEVIGPAEKPFSGGSSVPPSFLTGPMASSVPPSFMTESTPLVASASAEPPTTQGFSPPIMQVFPPPNFVEPVQVPIQEPPVVEVPQVTVPPVNASTFETSRFDAPPSEVLGTPLEPSSWSATPLVAATESPPPWVESWDGPASDISEIPPPSEFLHSSTLPRVLSPNPLARTPVDTQSPAHEQIIHQPIEEHTQAAVGNIRIAKSVSSSVPASVPTREETEGRLHAFSSSDSIPLDSATVSKTRYTQTSARKPPTFEPVKPDVSPTAPVVAFVRPNMPQQPEPQQPEQPVAARSVMVSPAAVKMTVTPIGPPRHIENSPSPVVAPSTREMVRQFVQSQRQLAESDDPDSIRQAFVQLTKLYELDRLEDSERVMMQPILDSLALKVIYARETHILEPPHRVMQGETIESIANDFDVTPALLRKINGLGMAQEVPTGTLLKVVYGQFDARISFQRRELTLLLGGLYAGRFSFSLPNENMPVHKGEFYVTNRTGQMFVLNNGWVLATGLVQNTTIVLTDKDAREIFDILSEQSVIVVE